MSTQRGLGKGLGALLGEIAPAPPEPTGGGTLPVQKIEPNPLQPRRRFDEGELRSLADSIAEHGVIQPLTVRKLDTGFYQIIAGERRWRAARMAGLTEVPAVVVEADDRKAMELALIENLQRQDLNPVEEAEGYRRLIDEYGMTQEKAAESVGRSRPAVTNALRLLSLPEPVLQMLEEDRLTAGHARALLQLKSEKKLLDAAQKIAALQLSVRQAELMCRSLAKERNREPAQAEALRVDYLAECEKNLSRRLGRGVKITSGKRKGRLDLEFYGPDDLQRLLDALDRLPLKEVVKK